MIDVVFDVPTPFGTVLDFVEEEVDRPVVIGERFPENVLAEALDHVTNVDPCKIERPVTGAIEADLPCPFAQVLLE